MSVESRRISIVERYLSEQEVSDLGIEHVYTFPAYDYEAFEKRLTRLQKRAKKLGVQPPEAHKVALDERECRHHFPSGSRGPWFRDRYIHVGLIRRPIRFADWRLVCVVQHTEAGNLLRTLDESVTIPAAFRTDSATCDHCQKKRHRNDTYVVAHTDGTLKRVGKTCLDDFTTTEDGVSALPMTKFLGAFFGMEDGIDGLCMGSRGVSTIDTEKFVATVCAFTRHIGYISARSARENGGESTARIVFPFLAGTMPAKEAAQYKDIEVNDDDRDKAKVALAWARAIGADGAELSDYQHNLKVASTFHWISDREAGIVGSILAAHDFHLGKLARRQAAKAARRGERFFGSVGDKIGRKLSSKDKKKGIAAHPALTGVITKATSWEGDFGTTAFYVIECKDEDSGYVDVLVWFSSGVFSYGDGVRIEQGDKVSVQASIKKHTTRNNVKQTVLTRAKLTCVEKVSCAA